MTIEEKEQDWLKLPNIMLFGGTSREQLAYCDNFYEHEFSVDDRSYKTVEHLFQSYKFHENGAPTDYSEQIRTCKDGPEAKRLGAAKRLPREVLDAWKSGGSQRAMSLALAAKFAKGSELAQKLVADSGNALLVEKVEDDPTWDDKVWGAGKEGVGLNRMGVMLTNWRNELKGNAN